ncbi:cytochrome P450 [Streptomyces sp. B6B3]|uniref:cytochrome P450 family protein n=1 Tax=Streptomyces sp. B6B3 TaxID=3153570 RepID=UPI00325CB1D9
MTTTPAPIELDPTGRDVHAEAGRLRAAGPAVRVALPDGVVAWSVTRGDVVRTLLTHPAVSKDAAKSWPGYEPGAIPWLTAWTDGGSMFTADGEDHDRLRRLISQTFTARRVEAFRPAIEALVADLVTSLRARPPGTVVDLRAAFANEVPTRLIMDLFGVPEERRPETLRVVNGALDTSKSPDEAAAHRRDLLQAMRTLISLKRAEPGDDMITHLVTVRDVNGDQLTDPELVSTLILLIGAGTTTTIALLGWAVHELLSHPDLLADVRRGAASWADAIEETLRLHPPIVHLPLRYATADIDLGEGVTIRAGDCILTGFGAHGRDPAVHQDPEAFRLDRADKQHLAFGHGAHYCLGAPLARLEAGIALPELFAAFPDMRLALDDPDADPERQESFIANDLRALPVRLTPN